jgi:hypothetical protein
VWPAEPFRANKLKDVTHNLSPKVVPLCVVLGPTRCRLDEGFAGKNPDAHKTGRDTLEPLYAMAYIRGQQADDDTWAQMGCTGWS